MPCPSRAGNIPFRQPCSELDPNSLTAPTSRIRPLPSPLPGSTPSPKPLGEDGGTKRGGCDPSNSPPDPQLSLFIRCNVRHCLKDEDCGNKNRVNTNHVRKCAKRGRGGRKGRRRGRGGEGGGTRGKGGGGGDMMLNMEV